MKQRGFSLIELLIVVAIILVIAAIAIPNLLRAKIQANEASAVSSVRAINTAQVAYASTYAEVGYADDLAKLGSVSGGGAATSAHAALLDWILGCATQPCPKSGYSFKIVNVTQVGTLTTGYGITGVPTAPGVSGIRGFCSDNMNPVKYDPNGGTACTMDLQ
ncbi:MAG TPA: prepilin-type N-terminal cleavage/methylation domain-containing protein [Terriglobales bacterium]|nr:prepilin-type N-terminal cleavage/methylation domain-containing protein [Terriglobales bacterium]